MMTESTRNDMTVLNLKIKYWINAAKAEAPSKNLNKSVNGYEAHEIILCCYNILILVEIVD